DALPISIGNSSVGRRISASQEVVQHMNGIIEEIIIGFADRDVNFPFHFGAKDSPVLFQDQPEVVFLPMRDDGFIDLSASSIPKRHGSAFSTARSVHCVPRSPLLPGHRPAASKADD